MISFFSTFAALKRFVLVQTQMFVTRLRICWLAVILLISDLIKLPKKTNYLKWWNALEFLINTLVYIIFIGIVIKNVSMKSDRYLNNNIIRLFCCQRKELDTSFEISHTGTTSYPGFLRARLIFELIAQFSWKNTRLVTNASHVETPSLPKKNSMFGPVW